MIEILRQFAFLSKIMGRKGIFLLLVVISTATFSQNDSDTIFLEPVKTYADDPAFQYLFDSVKIENFGRSADLAIRNRNITELAGLAIQLNFYEKYTARKSATTNSQDIFEEATEILYSTKNIDDNDIRILISAAKNLGLPDSLSLSMFLAEVNASGFGNYGGSGEIKLVNNSSIEIDTMLVDGRFVSFDSEIYDSENNIITVSAGRGYVALILKNRAVFRKRFEIFDGQQKLFVIPENQ